MYVDVWFALDELWFAPTAFALLVNESNVRIGWNFQAAHFRSNSPESWKANSQNGGGALRFYGIHLLACAAELGYQTVCSAAMDAAASRFTCKLTAETLPDLEIELDSHSKVPSSFSVENASSEIRELDGFSVIELDRR